MPWLDQLGHRLSTLVDHYRRREIAGVAPKTNLLERAEYPDFMMEFSQAKLFTEKRDCLVEAVETALRQQDLFPKSTRRVG